LVHHVKLESPDEVRDACGFRSAACIFEAARTHIHAQALATASESCMHEQPAVSAAKIDQKIVPLDGSEMRDDTK
jgi:hypothetical protein